MLLFYASLECELETTYKDAKETIMEITTSWMEEGIAKGMQQGMQQEGLSLVIRQLARKLGDLPGSLLDAVRSLTLPMLEDLGDALLNFNRREDLEGWLREHGGAVKEQ